MGSTGRGRPPACRSVGTPQATVDHEVGAGSIDRLIRCQIQREGGDIRRLSESLDQLRREDLGGRQTDSKDSETAPLGDAESLTQEPQGRITSLVAPQASRGQHSLSQSSRTVPESILLCNQWLLNYRRYALPEPVLLNDALTNRDAEPWPARDLNPTGNLLEGLLDELMLHRARLRFHLKHNYPVCGSR